MDRAVRELMSSDVKTIERNDTLSIADEVMRMERIRHLVVVDEDAPGEVAGVLSQRDLFFGSLGAALGYGSSGARKVLETVRVKDVMRAEPITTTSDASIADAARAMLENKIGCLPVLEGGRLVGILTESDFLRLAIEAG